MHRQHAVVGEPSLTHHAHKPTSALVTGAAVMAAHVLVQVAALSERALAQRTDVRPLSAV